METSEYAVVYSSAGSLIEANSIAEALIEKKLAACVSIFPGVTSHYLWEGKKESSYEVVMMIKIVKTNFEDVKKEIREIHSFEVPEILMLPIIGGSADYLDWMKSVSE